MNLYETCGWGLQLKHRHAWDDPFHPFSPDQWSQQTCPVEDLFDSEPT